MSVNVGEGQFGALVGGQFVVGFYSSQDVVLIYRHHRGIVGALAADASCYRRLIGSGCCGRQPDEEEEEESEEEEGNGSDAGQPGV